MHKACKTLVKPNGSPLKNIYAKIFAPANAGPGSCCQALFDGETVPTDVTDFTVAEFQALQANLWTNSQHGFFYETNPKDNANITCTKSNRKTEEAVVIVMKKRCEHKGGKHKGLTKRQLTQIKIQCVNKDTTPDAEAVTARRRQEAILKGISLCERIVAGTLAYDDVNKERNRLDELEGAKCRGKGKLESLETLEPKLESELNAALEPKPPEAEGKEKPAAAEKPAARQDGPMPKTHKSGTQVRKGLMPQKEAQVPPAAGGEPAPSESEEENETQATDSSEDTAASDGLAAKRTKWETMLAGLNNQPWYHDMGA